MDLRVFLSSTFEDLKGAREQIVRLLSVIPAELVRMEVFGSDETRPVEYCLQRVRGCNLFVGIYAERYGSIDPESGLSITELEYREAAQLAKEKRLLGLLLYILSPSAKWEVRFVDRGRREVRAIEAFKSALKKNHTVSFFDDIETLPLQVLRDILRKIGVGPGLVFRAKAPTAPTPRAVHVMGMEHYTDRDAAHFHGREHDVAELAALIDGNPLSLLVGDSGVGKTSLVQAGLFPVLRARGWTVASCRPLDNADSILPKALWSQLIRDPFPADASLTTALGIIESAYGQARVLIVIDQFEDAIPYLGEANTSDFLATLARMHSAPPANLRMLLCYRGDADPKVGRYWQVVSGSPTGLPRHYLEPLRRDAVELILSEVLAPHFSSRDLESDKQLVCAIAKDLENESIAILERGVYPPFLQMVAEGLVRATKSRRVRFSGGLYRSLGTAPELIGRYLINQLRFLGKYESDARQVLLALAAQGRRLRKPAEQIAGETGISIERVTACLNQMASLRLVRCQEDSWEIVHDFLAARVLRDLVDPEEREARTFRDLLIAKTATFQKTRDLLTVPEHLGIYAHRKRLRCSQAEIEMLFRSTLAGRGPIGYYLSQVPTDVCLRWAREHLSSENEGDASEIRANAYRFVLKHDGSALTLSSAVEALGDHKLQFELAPLIARLSTRADIPLLLRLRNKKAEMVAGASRESLARLLKGSDEAALQTLLRSGKSADLRLLYRVLSSSGDADRVAKYRANLASRRLLTRVSAICTLGTVGTTHDLDLLRERLQSSEGKDLWITGHTLAQWSQKHRCKELLLSLLAEKRDGVPKGALLAINNARASIPVSVLLPLYERCPEEVGEAILRCVRPADRLALRRFVKSIPLRPPARDLLRALAQVGSADDVRFILRLVAAHDLPIDFWNVPLLADSLARSSDRSLLAWLRKLTQSEEFWRYVGRSDPKPKKSLPVRAHENQYLFKRLVASCLARICKQSEWRLLRKLASHDYWMIQVAAGERIAQFAGQRELDELISDMRQRREDASAGSVRVLCLVDEAVYGTASARWPPKSSS